VSTLYLQLAIGAGPGKLPVANFRCETAVMNDASGPDLKTSVTEAKPTLFERRMLLAVYQQNWENARHIKNERLSFTNIYCIVAAGMLSLLHTVAGKRVLEISMLFFLVLFSFIGLLTSLRLKAELEECLHKIDQIVSQTGVEPISALNEAKGVTTRYPKFRWIFPWFYSIGTIGFVILLWQRVVDR
jgi:hypothetical protein